MYNTCIADTILMLTDHSNMVTAECSPHYDMVMHVSRTFLITTELQLRTCTINFTPWTTIGVSEVIMQGTPLFTLARVICF